MRARILALARASRNALNHAVKTVVSRISITRRMYSIGYGLSSNRAPRESPRCRPLVWYTPEPAFGAFWFTSLIDTNEVPGMAIFHDIKVTRARYV